MAADRYRAKLAYDEKKDSYSLIVSHGERRLCDIETDVETVNEYAVAFANRMLGRTCERINADIADGGGQGKAELGMDHPAPPTPH